MAKILDFLAPRERQHYMGPSTRFRVMPRHIDWSAVALTVWIISVVTFVTVAMVTA